MLFLSSVKSVKMFAGVCFVIVAVHSLQFADGKHTKDQSGDRIIYPGPVQNISNRYGDDSEADIPDDCKGQNFCTIKPPNYPQERFNNMFKGYKVISPPTLVLDDLSDRTSDSTDGCRSEVTFEPLYQVKSLEGDWRTVVQAPEEDFVQSVRLERCEEPNGSCFNVYQPDPGVEVFCKQQYNKWKVLVALGKSGTEHIEVDLPVCCTCHYRLS